MSEAPTRLRLHNTLTRTKEDFAPIDPENVRMYVCGPTVYDLAHIGNARPVIVFDVLYRLLRHLYREDRVAYVRNITDVDDKINARARRDYPDLPLNEAIRRVTEATTKQFREDVAALGCLAPTHEPRATDFVLAREDGRTDMAGLIQALIDRGHAYVAEGESGAEVLFDTASMPDYGELSRRNLDEQQAGARVAVEAHKKSPADFVLWKESAADEPGWEATFRGGGGERTIRGRPGWHIECSAMSDALLWDALKDRLSPEALARPHQFDIHGGGIDLVFPHHENEIAQSRCAHGTETMARYWLHNGFLQVEGRKMAKSEGNFVTIHDLLHTEKFGGRKWPGEVLRLAMLMTHYREPIDFSVRKLEEAEEVLDGWYRAVGDTPSSSIFCADTLGALLDDLRSPGAISALHELRAQAAKGSDSAKRCLKASGTLLGLLERTESEWAKAKLGSLRQSAAAKVSQVATLIVYEPDSALSEETIEASINERLAFIREKNFAEADRIRDELAGRGIQLKDSKDPETGERVTTWEVKR